VTPQDFDYLRKLLRDRSGLVLSAEKQYLAESRLVPSHAATASRLWANWSPSLKTAEQSPLATDVIEAMATNETFFFRDKLPFDHFSRHHTAGADCGTRARETHPHLVHRGLDRAGALFAGDDPARVQRQARRLSRRDYRHRYFRRGPDARQGRHLQPVRSAARIADPASGEVFQPGRRNLADRARDPRHGAIRPLNLLKDSRRSALSTWCSAATC